MMPETWLALLAGALLAAVALARTLALFGVGLDPRRWDLLIAGGRGVAAVTLAVALGLGLVAREACSPLTTCQVALSLALAALILHLALWWRHGFDGAGPVIDLSAVVLVAVAMVAHSPADQVLTCVQAAIPNQVQQTLFLVGVGGAVVMGACGLMQALCPLLARRKQDLDIASPADLCDFMEAATALTLVILGSGLVVGAWWAWQSVGRLSSGDSVAGWMAATWLLAAIGWLSWRLAERDGRWAAVLAVLTALWAGVGLLAGAQLRYLFGF